MKTTAKDCLLKYSCVVSMSLLFGCSWCLGPNISFIISTVVTPIFMPIIVYILFFNRILVYKSIIFSFSVILAEVLRMAFYVCYGNGLDYLLHDGETQSVLATLFIWQLVLGYIIMIVCAFARKHMRIRKLGDRQEQERR